MTIVIYNTNSNAMSTDIKKAKATAWIYRNIDITAAVVMVIKAMSATNSYYIPIKHGAEPNVWVWFGVLMMSIGPVILMFGLLKMFLRRELIHLEGQGIIKFSDTGLTEMTGDTTETLRSVDLNISQLMKFTMTVLSVVVTFYFGVRIILPEVFSGIAWVYLLDVTMVLIPAVSLILFKSSNHSGNMNATV